MERVRQKKLQVRKLKEMGMKKGGIRIKNEGKIKVYKLIILGLKNHLIENI